MAIGNSGGDCIMERKENKILIGAIIGLMVFSMMPAFAEPPQDVFTKTIVFDLTYFTYSSCRVQANYESGVCDFIYACYVILPKGSSSLSQVYQKECNDVTGLTTYSMTVATAPPKGTVYAVSPFITKVHYTYDNVGYKWNTPVASIVPGKSCTRTSDCQAGMVCTKDLNPSEAPDTSTCTFTQQVITYCSSNDRTIAGPQGEQWQGKVLKGNDCIDYVGVCANTMNSNMCTNSYDALCLDISIDGTQAGFCNQGSINITDAERTCMLNRCQSDQNRVCIDRLPKDAVCDAVISLTCSDLKRCVWNLTTLRYDLTTCAVSPCNNICDESDQIFCGLQCTDANLNGICDDKETNGCFCNLIYDPVCWTQATTKQCLLTTECAGVVDAVACPGKLKCPDNSCQNNCDDFQCFGASPQATPQVQGLCKKAVTYPNPCFATCAGKTPVISGACKPLTEQIQCYRASDCGAPYCDGGSWACINYMCVPVSACNPYVIRCNVAIDCGAIPCPGTQWECTAQQCIPKGKCIVPPTQPPNIWDLILNIWNTFIGWVKSLFGWQ